MVTVIKQSKCRISSAWTSDTEYAFGLNRIFAIVLGIWPLDPPDITAYIRILFIIITQLSMALTIIVQISTKGNCGTMGDVADVLTLITCGFLTALKVSIPKILNYKMYKIISAVVEDWNKLNDEKSRRIMLKYATIGRKMFIIMTSCSYIAATPLIIIHIPFIVSSLHSGIPNGTVYSVPIGPDCWIPQDTSIIYYIIYFILQTVQLLVTCTGFTFGDTFFFSIGMHVCGQFKVLSANFNQLNFIYDNCEKQKFLSKFIKRHQQLLLLANNVEDVFNIIILGQVVGDTILLCVTTLWLLISLQLGDVTIIWQHIIRIFISYTQLFIYCYVGEQLNMHYQKLRIVIYNLKWYKMPYATVRDMKFIIMRTNRPIYLTAGKMYNMNHENFTNIIKTMGSFFSILRLMLADIAR